MGNHASFGAEALRSALKANLAQGQPVMEKEILQDMEQTTAEISEEPVSDFTYGEKVWRRDHGKPWGVGFVIGLHPLKISVLLDSSASGWTWDEVHKRTAWNKQWQDLSPEEEKAARTCGWTWSSWFEDDDVPIHDLFWEQIPEKKREALELLGCTPEIWNEAESRATADALVVGQTLTANICVQADEVQVNITNLAGIPIKDDGFCFATTGTLQELEDRMGFSRSVVVRFLSEDGSEVQKMTNLKDFSILILCSKDPKMIQKKKDQEQLQEDLVRVHNMCRKSYNPANQALMLEHQRITDREASLLVKLLLSYPDLKELRLNSNRIGDDGAKNIAKALPTLANLVRLEIHGNPISDDVKQKLRISAEKCGISLPYL
jgi:PAS domain-containing protein